FWGLDMITKKTMGKLKFTILGNPATHMPQGLGGIPGFTGMSTKMMKKQIADLDVPDVPEFMEMLHEMGVTMWACRMSVDMMDLDMDDFFEGVEDVISAGDFMEINEGAQLLFT
ncbi:MAG: DsrE/DsrF/DrsH-like family protein, partial [Acidimicrobiia bacterium]